MANGRLLLVYEPEHIPLMAARMQEGDIVLALDYEIELDLKKLGIPFLSLAALSVSPGGDREVLEWTRRLAREWYDCQETAFLRYDGIKLGEQYEVSTLYCLQALMYHLATLKQVFAGFPNLKKIIVPETFVVVPPTADPAGAVEQHLQVHVARLLGGHMGIEVEVAPAPLAHRTRGGVAALKRMFIQAAVGAASRASNFLVTLLTRRRPIVLLATDPWVRLEPFIKDMHDVELVMTRRAEMPAMGLSNIARSRARFHHRLDFIDSKARALAKERAQDISRQWEALGDAPVFSRQFVYQDISFWPVARLVLDAIVKDSEDAIATIENTKRLIAHYKVNCVLLFASTKGYNLVIARVAENLDIPSIELEHALVNNEKTLVHCRLNSRYLASYGPLINRMYESWGVEPWRLISCGSPRFDGYAKPPAPAALAALRERLKLGDGCINVLFAMQHIYTTLEYGNFNSYEMQQIVEDVASVQKENPHARVLLRPRPGKARQSYYHRAETLAVFLGEIREVQWDNLRALFELTDLVITGGSTMVIESILAKRPVVMYLPKLLDRDFQAFEDAGAVLVARTQAELKEHVAFLSDSANRKALAERADEFVRKNFTLDGNSAQRVAALLRRVTGGAESSTMPL